MPGGNGISQHSSFCCWVLPAAELTNPLSSPFPLHQDVTLLLKLLLLPPHPLSRSLSVLLFACTPWLQQVFCKSCATQRSRGHISFRQVTSELPFQRNSEAFQAKSQTQDLCPLNSSSIFMENCTFQTTQVHKEIVETRLS